MTDYTNRNKNRQSTHKSRTSSAAQKAESSFAAFFIIALVILIGAYFLTNDSNMEFISEKKQEALNFVNKDNKNQNEKSNKKYELIYFVNSSNSIRKIYWVNRNGSKKLYKSLKAGESHSQRAYPHHKWLISDESDRELGIFQSKGEKNYITMYDSIISHTNEEFFNKEEKTKKVSKESGAKKLGIKNTLNKPRKSIKT